MAEKKIIRKQKSIRLREDVINFVENIAYKDNRSFDNMIETILLNLMKNNNMNNFINNEIKKDINEINSNFTNNHIPYSQYRND